MVNIKVNLILIMLEQKSYVEITKYYVVLFN